MSVVDATPDQLNQLADFVRLERTACAELWQLNKKISALILAWNANILGIVGAPQNTPIPIDNTGFDGALTLTDTQVTNIFGILQAMQSSVMTDANKAAFVLATGPDKTL